MAELKVKLDTSSIDVKKLADGFEMELNKRFRTVAGARRRIAALEGLSDSQVEIFISTFNRLEEEGTEESAAIPQAIAAANRANKGIIKNTNQDKTKILRDAIDNQLATEDTMCYLLDFTDDFVYIEKYNRFERNESKTYQVGYSIVDFAVTFDDEFTEVIRETFYAPVGGQQEDEDIERGVKKTIIDTLKSFFKKEDVKQHVINKFDEEQMLEYSPLYCPPETADSDGQGMTKQDIINMVDGINKCIKEGTLEPNLFHKVKTNAYEFKEAFVNPWHSCLVGDKEVIEGQPVLVKQWKNKKAWELRKAGILKGDSIGARAKRFRKVEN